MARFLITYHGAGMPSDPELAAQAKEAFGRWLKSAGNAVVDPGSPLRLAAKVSNATAVGDIAIGGYTLLEAPSVEDVVRILKSHPFAEKGGTLQINEVVAV